MEKTLYVIGHCNPDTDSIASAIGYAALKQRLGNSNIVAAMAGEPNPQTGFILDRLGIPAPLYLADVHPKVRDVLNRQPITLEQSATVHDALERFHASGVRVLPVLDDAGRPCGSLSLLRLSETHLLPCADRQREIRASRSSLEETLSGHFVVGHGLPEVETFQLFIGAMMEESFSSRIASREPRSLMIMTGNRRAIQMAAIDRGVGLLIVTGHHEPEPDVLEAARRAGVDILVTPHDTATAAWLARLSSPVALVADRAFTTIGIGEPLTQLKKKLLSSKDPAILAIEEDGTLAGVVTKSSLLAPVPYGLILVDHNEFAQAVPGADAVEIVEVLDHHKLGNGPTVMPITFLTSPVGSTCSLVAARYREVGMTPEPPIAALLLAGILSDTVLLKSPTTTQTDRKTVEWLEGLSGVKAEEFGREIFAASSSLKHYGSPSKIVEADFKVFNHDQKAFGVGQVEVVGFVEFSEMKEDLLACLSEIRKKDGLLFAGLMVTDIASETTHFLVDSQVRMGHAMEYPQLEPHLYEMKGVMSRKKQMVPHLIKVLSRL